MTNMACIASRSLLQLTIYDKGGSHHGIDGEIEQALKVLSSTKTLLSQESSIDVDKQASRKLVAIFEQITKREAVERRENGHLKRTSFALIQHARNTDPYATHLPTFRSRMREDHIDGSYIWIKRGRR